MSHLCIKKFCNFLETAKLYSTRSKHQLLQYDVNTEPYFICCPKWFYIDIHLETAQFSHGLLKYIVIWCFALWRRRCRIHFCVAAPLTLLNEDNIPYIRWRYLNQSCGSVFIICGTGSGSSISQKFWIRLRILRLKMANFVKKTFKIFDFCISLNYFYKVLQVFFSWEKKS